MSDLEVRDLTYFIAVAEELNFSRAAQRLGIAQPPLSRAIRHLERRLGVQLFERDTRRVTLTAAGLTLLDEARPALAAMSAASHRTQRAAQVRPTLVATGKPGAPTAMLREIVDAYRQLPGAVDVEIVVSGYRGQAGMVLDGRADVALLSSPFQHRGLEVEPLATEPRVAALPAGHPLADRGRLRCHDLHGEPIPQWPQWTTAELRYWSGRDRPFSGDHLDESDPEPIQVGPVVSDPAQLLEVVSLGQAVALIPQSVAADSPRTDIAYRPVDDASPYIIAIAWPEGSRSPAVAAFVRCALKDVMLEPVDSGTEG